MSLDEILAPWEAECSAHTAFAAFARDRRLVADPPTWNDLRWLAERMIALGTRLAERLDDQFASRMCVVREEHLWHAAREAQRRGVDAFPLVRADPVECPDCGGAGGFGRGEGAEGCDMCGMTGTVPRSIAEQIAAHDTLWRPVRDAWLLEQLKTIQPIDEL